MTHQHQHQHQHQQQVADDARPMDVEPAHVMTREKHKQREHYERLLREIQGDQLDEKMAASLGGQKTTSGFRVERSTPETELNYG